MPKKYFPKAKLPDKFRFKKWFSFNGFKTEDEAFRIQQLYFEQLFMNTSDAIVALDTDQRILNLNPAFTRLFGYRLKEVLGKSLQHLIIPNDLLSQSDRLMKQTLQKKKISLETVRRHKNGRAFAVSITGAPIVIKGKVVGVYGIYRDISERKKRQEKLRKSERTLAALMGNLPGMAYRCLPDDNLTLEFTSEGCFPLTGYRPDELIRGKVATFNSLIHPDDYALNIAGLKKAIKTKKPFKMVYRIYDRKGRLKWVLERGSGLYSSSGKFLSFEGFVADITDQKGAETNLATSKKLLDDIMQGSPIATYVIGVDRKILYWNKALERMTGRKASEMLGTRKHWEVFYSKKRSMVVDYMVNGKSIPDILKHYKHMDVEENKIENGVVGSVYFPHFYGGGRWLRFKIKPLYDLSGEMIGAIETVENIHDRKIAERDLRERRDELEVLYRVNAHSLMARSLSRVLQDVANDVILALRFLDVAYSRITFDGRRYSPSGVKNAKRFVRKIEAPIVVRGKKRGKIELGYLKKHPDMPKGFFVSDEKKLLNDVALTLSRHVNSREIFERHEKLLRKLTVGVFILQNGVFKYVNPRFCKLFKLKREQILGRPYSDLVLNCHSPFMKQTISHCEAMGKSGNNQLIRLEINTQKIQYDGRHGILGTLQDISQLKQAQERMRDFNVELKAKIAEKTQHLKEANKRLQSLNDLKDEFIAVTSHELRSPLTAIRGYLSFLQDEETMDLLPRESRSYLSRSYNNVEMLNNLVNNILDVSKLESGRFSLKRSPVNLIAFIKNIIDNLSIHTQQKKLNIHFVNKVRRKKFVVSIDKIRFHQVMINLLENAIKYSKRGKDITVQLSVKRNRVLIRVIDQGIGIPQSQIPHIFEKFMQAKNAKARYKGGAGLGLFITQKIIELHGGTINVVSSNGNGTTFTILLPL